MSTTPQVLWDQVQWDDEPKKKPSLLNRLNDWYTKESDVPNDPYAIGKGVLPAGGSQKESPRSATMNTALMSAVPLTGPALAAPIATGLGLAGAAVGSKFGRYAGEAMGAPDIGEDVGGLMGGLISGMGGTKLREANNSVAGALRKPATPMQAEQGIPGSVKPILPEMLQKYTIPDWAIPKGEVGTPTNPGPFNRVPNRVSPQFRGDPFAPPAQAAPIATNPFTPKGEIPYGSVIQLPEPNEAVSPINPKYMGSVPRNELVGMGKSRTPGAGTQLQQIGNKVIYTPPEGFNPPKEVTSFSSEGKPYTISNAMGIRWAKTPGIPDISIPNGMADADIPAYIAEKQKLQINGSKGLFQ